eukprot:TRINITY_DN6856_c0_g1_i1.p1 TRINITY_DN6856_c0_g1~~TRINITY_DN6856_c0_g1_i1.p1  ORF type:complete len:491 (-),score=21.30 TRINITY_DN6856_c0_g1_i1:436-1908(-)
MNRYTAAPIFVPMQISHLPLPFSVTHPVVDWMDPFHGDLHRVWAVDNLKNGVSSVTSSLSAPDNVARYKALGSVGAISSFFPMTWKVWDEAEFEARRTFWKGCGVDARLEKTGIYNGKLELTIPYDPNTPAGNPELLASIKRFKARSTVRKYHQLHLPPNYPWEYPSLSVKYVRFVSQVLFRNVFEMEMHMYNDAQISSLVHITWLALTNLSDSVPEQSLMKMKEALDFMNDNSNGKKSLRKHMDYITRIEQAIPGQYTIVPVDVSGQDGYHQCYAVIFRKSAVPDKWCVHFFDGGCKPEQKLTLSRFGLLSLAKVKQIVNPVMPKESTCLQIVNTIVGIFEDADDRKEPLYFSQKGYNCASHNLFAAIGAILYHDMNAHCKSRSGSEIYNLEKTCQFVTMGFIAHFRRHLQSSRDLKNLDEEVNLGQGITIPSIRPPELDEIMADWSKEEAKFKALHLKYQDNYVPIPTQSPTTVDSRGFFAMYNLDDD